VEVTRSSSQPEWHCGRGGCQTVYVVAAHTMASLFDSPATSLIEVRGFAFSRLAAGLPFSQH
jgi:hypothetical protein